jgi:hypothetical protein
MYLLKFPQIGYCHKDQESPYSFFLVLPLDLSFIILVTFWNRGVTRGIPTNVHARASLRDCL